MLSACVENFQHQHQHQYIFIIMYVRQIIASCQICMCLWSKTMSEDNDHGWTSYTTSDKRLCRSLSCKHDTSTFKKPKTAFKYAIN